MCKKTLSLPMCCDFVKNCLQLSFQFFFIWSTWKTYFFSIIIIFCKRQTFKGKMARPSVSRPINLIVVYRPSTELLIKGVRRGGRELQSPLRKSNRVPGSHSIKDRFKDPQVGHLPAPCGRWETVGDPVRGSSRPVLFRKGPWPPERLGKDSQIVGDWWLDRHIESGPLKLCNVFPEEWEKVQQSKSASTS